MVNAPTTQQPITPEEVTKMTYLAKQVGSVKTYNYFQQQLAAEKIPWSINDRRFLQKYQWLKDTLIAELGAHNEEGLRQLAETSFSHALSEEERAGMMEGIKQIRAQEKTHQQNLFQHTEALVDTYVEKLKKQTALSPEQESAVRETVFKAAKQTVEGGDVSGIIKKIELAAADAQIDNESASSAAASLDLSLEMTRSANELARLSKITETTLTAGDEFHKGALIEKCLNNPDIPPELIANKHGGELQALKLFSLSQDVQKNIDTELGDQKMRRAALERAAESASKGVGRPVGDVVKAMGWDAPEIKNTLSGVFDIIVGTSTKELRENSGVSRGITITPTVWADPRTQEKVRQLELAVARRNKTWESTRDMSKGFVQRSALAGIKNQALANDAVSMWKEPVQKALAVYLETVSVKAHAFAPEYFHYFILAGTDIWDIVLNRSAKKAAGAAAKTAGAALLQQGGKRVAEAAGNTALKGAAAATGNPVVMFFAAAGGKVISFIWGGIKALFSFLQFKEIGRGILQAASAPRRSKDESLVFAFMIAAGILVVLYMTLFREAVITSAIVAEKKENLSNEETSSPGRGFPHGDPTADAEYNAAVTKASGVKREKKTPVDYAADPENAARIEDLKNNADTTLLVTSSNPNHTPRISQMPGDSYTHGKVNAVDVTAPIQSLAHSPVNGVVTKVVNEYADGSGFAGSTDGRGYGNYIEITTTEGYVLRVAHLAFNSMPAEGTTVSVGDVIGRSGQTGNSTGPHFHFEFIGSGAPSILTIFNP